MRVVVTGAFGYVGLALLQRLAGAWSIVAVGHSPHRPTALPPGVEARHGDLTLAAEALDGADAIVHLAGGGGEAKCRADPVRGVRTNVRGTSLLVEAARRAGVRRLIFASTIAVYGTFRQHGRPCRETDELAPDDLYGSLKEAAEYAWTALGGGTALRLANVYGAGPGVDLGGAGAVERFARAAARGGELEVYGDGSQRIDYVHVDDVVEAFRLAVEANDLPPAINIGGGGPCSIRKLAEMSVRAGEALGARPHVVTRPAPEGKIWPDRSLAIDLARMALGWRPRVPLEAGVAELVPMMRG